MGVGGAQDRLWLAAARACFGSGRSCSRVAPKTHLRKGGEMKRLVLALGSLAVAGVLIPTSVGAPVAVVNGGGNGTFDGTTAGSHFGFGVIYGTGAGGKFQCNMAGNAAFDGLREMGL